MTDPTSPQINALEYESRLHRRRRFRRRGRKAYIRSVYFLPSLATLGNAICGFAAIYVSALAQDIHDPWWSTQIAAHPFEFAAYLILIAMGFDALDGRLARFTRHTTDFGGQLDSLADVISFGAAPAFLALRVFKDQGPQISLFTISRIIWSIGALYMSCAAIRLAKFNVSNKHGEQHHFSFLGLPSPGAAGAVVGFVLMQQHLLHMHLPRVSYTCVLFLPPLVLMVGLLMVSNIRYPHLVNRYLRGKQSFARLVIGVIVLLLLITAHQFTLAFCTITYALWGPAMWAYLRWRKTLPPPPPSSIA